MKPRLKIFILLALSFLYGNSSSAQMTICIPPMDPPCNPPCMEVDIINNLPCDLDFYWGYGGCTYIIGAKKFTSGGGCTPSNCAPGVPQCSSSVPPPSPCCPTPNCRLYGPCAKCPGDLSQCECPDKLMLVDAFGTNIFPWGTFTTMLVTGNIVIDYTGASNTICPACLNGVRVTITITGTNSCTMQFDCI